MNEKRLYLLKFFVNGKKRRKDNSYKFSSVRAKLMWSLYIREFVVGIELVEGYEWDYILEFL